MGKKVLIITGSPRQKGNTNALAAAFASGAVAAGNEVEVFDAATANLHGCSGDKTEVLQPPLHCRCGVQGV